MCILDHNVRSSFYNQESLETLIYSKGLANVFCKGPDSKYLRLLGPYGICHNYSALLL